MSETFEIIETEVETTKQKPNDLAEVAAGAILSINFKSLIFLFILYIFITSDIFNDKFLSRFSNSVENRNPTTKGSFIAGFTLVILYMFADLAIEHGII